MHTHARMHPHVRARAHAHARARGTHTHALTHTHATHNTTQAHAQTHAHALAMDADMPLYRGQCAVSLAPGFWHLGIIEFELQTSAPGCHLSAGKGRAVAGGFGLAAPGLAPPDEVGKTGIDAASLRQGFGRLCQVRSEVDVAVFNAAISACDKERSQPDTNCKVQGESRP